MGRASRKNLSGPDVRASSLDEIKDIASEISSGNPSKRAIEASGVLDYSMRQAADGTDVLDVVSLRSEVEAFTSSNDSSVEDFIVNYERDPQLSEAVFRVFYNMSPSEVQNLYESVKDAGGPDEVFEAALADIEWREPADTREIVEQHLRPSQPAFRQHQDDSGLSVFVGASEYIDPGTSELYHIDPGHGQKIWQGNIVHGTFSYGEGGQRDHSLHIRCEEKRNWDGRAFQAEAGDHQVVVAEAFGDQGEPQRTVARIRRDGQEEEVRELSEEEVAVAGGAEGWALLELGRGLLARDKAAPEPAEFNRTDVDQQIERLFS